MFARVCPVIACKKLAEVNLSFSICVTATVIKLDFYKDFKQSIYRNMVKSNDKTFYNGSVFR